MKTILLNYDLREALPALRSITEAIKKNEITLSNVKKYFVWKGYQIYLMNIQTTNNTIQSYSIKILQENKRIGNIKFKDDIIEYSLTEDFTMFPELC